MNHLNISNDEKAKAAVSAIFGVANDKQLVSVAVTSLTLDDKEELVVVIDREGCFEPEAPPPEGLVSFTHTAVYLPSPYAMTTTVAKLTDKQTVDFHAFIATQLEAKNGL